MGRTNEQVTISFSRVDYAGFYAWGKKTPTFGSLADSLLMLRQWGNGKAIPLTKCIDPEGNDNDAMPAYLLGAEEFSGEWLVGIWNEIESTDGSVASVPMSAVVGSVQADMSELPKNSIPGFATYFWILPKQNLIATIRFQHRSTGLKRFSAYMERFLGAYSKNAIREKKDDGSSTVVGYSSDGKNNPTNKVAPRFRIAPYMKDGELAHLRANVDGIQKVIRRGHMVGTNPVDVSFLASVVRWVRGTQKPQAISKSKSIYVEFEYTPTLSELNAMIKAQSQDASGGAYDDMGFKIRGDEKIFWISKSNASDKFMLAVDRQDAEVVNLGSIWTAIDDQRTDVLRLL